MTAYARLRPWERIALGFLVALFVAFGAVVELRAAFSQLRQTDFGVYARVGWAVRAGENIYAVEDDRHWHYCYPPPFAILMTPLADPPAGEDRTGYLPFAVSVGVWYLFSLGCAVFAVDLFAKAILPQQPPGTRRWWSARTGPFVAMLGAVGYTLARGQGNLFVVALIAGMFAAHVRGKRFTAGLWLGAAVCVKVIPAFLGLFFLLKRDTRAIGGTATALVVGLGLLPTAVWGVDGAIELNKQMLTAVLQPGTTGGGDQTRAEELTNSASTDSQSIQAVLHNLLHPNSATRPTTAAPETRLAHWLIGGLLTLAVVLAARRMEPTPANDLLLLGALATVMLHLTPVSHMHYYAFGLPLVCGVWLKSLSENPGRLTARGWSYAAVAFWGATTAVPLFPGPVFDVLRSSGLGLFASLVVLAFTLTQLRTKGEETQAEIEPPVRRAA